MPGGANRIQVKKSTFHARSKQSAWLYAIILGPVFIAGGCQMTRDFSGRQGNFSCHTSVWQEKLTQYVGKRPGQMVFSGCEYRFLIELNGIKWG